METTEEDILKKEERKAALRREARTTHMLIWFLLGISAILAGFIYVQNLPPPAHKYDTLAKCIAQSSTTFYGAWWCPDCAMQKTKFGTGAQYLPYQECANPDKTENATCAAASVSRYPTWVFKDGSRSIGVQSPETLAKKTNCSMIQ